MTTAPIGSVQWYKPVNPEINYKTVPMPDETTPYFPPNIPLQPVEKFEPYRTKSPFCEALTIAPLRPFTPFENDVITQFEDLPNPPKDVKLTEALTTAPDEPVSQLNPDMPETETDAERAVRLESEQHAKEAAEVKQLILKTVDSELSKKCTSFAPFRGFRSVDPFKPMPPYQNHRSSVQSLSHYQSRSSSVCADSSNQESEIQIDQTQTDTSTTAKATTTTTTNAKNNQTIKACTTKETNRNSFAAKKTSAFPPPPGTPVKSYVQSGLHSPKTIPKYQRQWFNLPSQSPIRTPEPTELRENVPIAFIDTQPQEETHEISKPIAITISAPPEITKTEAIDVKASIVDSTVATKSAAPTIVPALSENRAGPITMTFQSIDPTQLPPRPTTPSLINKPPPMIPYYQQNLVYEEFGAQSSNLFDPRKGTPSPRPDVCRSPAPGPPPNVLKIQAPRIKTSDALDYSVGNLQSITSDQSGIRTFNQTTNSQLVFESKKGYQVASQSFHKQPETVYSEKRDGLNVETRTSGSQLNEAKKSDMQTSSTFQVGNTQIQRRQRVVEEYEHTQKANTTEIHKNYESTSSQYQQATQSSNDYETDTYGKGFVARQARRLSEAPNANKNVVASYHFPQTVTPLTTAGFPISNSSCVVEVPREQPREQPQNVATRNTQNFQIAQNQSMQSVQSVQSVQIQSQNVKSVGRTQAVRNVPSPQKIAFPPQFDFGAYEPAGNNNQYNTNLTVSDSTTKQSSAKISDFQSLTPPVQSAFSSNPNTSSFKRTSNTSPLGYTKPPYIDNQSTFVSDPTPASAGPSSKGTSSVGATSTPNRGRGVLNASVAPGGRIPKCGCCGTQIR